MGTVAEFLGLTPKESALVEIKLALSRKLRQRRQKQLTQAEPADKIGSSQPRRAKAENGDRSVSSELLLRAIGDWHFPTGNRRNDFGSRSF